MRDEAPHGGRSDKMIDLHMAGFLSTTSLTSALGLTGTLPPSFIVNELGIKPHYKLSGGYYWAPEQVGEVRRALIRKLSDKATEWISKREGDS
jgi:hypothetical protein